MTLELAVDAKHLMGTVTHVSAFRVRLTHLSVLQDCQHGRKRKTITQHKESMSSVGMMLYRINEYTQCIVPGDLLINIGRTQY